MPDIKNQEMDLDQKAAAALARMKANGHQIPEKEKTTATRSIMESNQISEEYDVIPAPPTDAEMAETATTSSQVTENTPVYDDEEEVIVSGSKETTPPATEEDETVILTSMAKEHLGNVDPTDRDSFIEGLIPEVASFKKDLIINQGMTPAEATKAAENRLKRKANEYAENWAKEHPEGIILTINKAQEENLELDDETMNKVQKAKLIKLVTVESQELASLKIKKSKKDRVTMSHLRDICGSISRFSVPLLAKGDYAYFNGAQSAVLANATADEGDTFVARIEKKASVLYRYFAGSTLRDRKNPDGTEMSYEDFCNWFAYDDIGMGLYAIVTASTMEESETAYICQNEDCHRPFNITYNNKALLDLSDLNETYKKRLTDIDEARSSITAMKKISEECNMALRFKSPFSNNIYELTSPSIAEARHRLDECSSIIANQTVDDLVVYMIPYVSTFWIYDKTDDSYEEINMNESPADGLDIMMNFHPVDLELVGRQINELRYDPAFRVHVNCPHCHRESTDSLGIDGMIFLHARALLTEIM